MSSVKVKFSDRAMKCMKSNAQKKYLRTTLK